MRRVVELKVPFALFALALLAANAGAQVPKQTPKQALVPKQAHVPAALPVQTPKPKPLPQAAIEYQVKPEVSAAVSPNPATVNRQVQLQANPRPATGPWEFEFHMDGTRLTECAATSPVCDWTPRVAGGHLLIVLGRFGRPSRGGARGGSGPVEAGDALKFGVNPEPPPPPPPPPATPTPIPELSVRQVSGRVVVNEPAQFEVSLKNAKSSEYQIDFGDGKFTLQADQVFEHKFEKDGPVTIVVRYTDANPPLEQRLPVSVEPAAEQSPTPTPASSARPTTTPAPSLTPTPTPVGGDDGAEVGPYVLAGAILLGALIIARAISKKAQKPRPPEDPLPPPVPTFHPEMKRFDPRFAQKSAGGVSLVVIYVHDLQSLRFSSTRTTSTEG